MELQTFRIVKAIMNRKNNTEAITLYGFKRCCEFVTSRTHSIGINKDTPME